MSDGVAGHFEGFADYSRYGRGLWRAYRRRAARLLAERLGPPPWRVLDLGGGSMPSLPDLLADPRLGSWLVVDLVDKLPTKPPKLSLEKADAATFIAGYRGQPFDAVLCFGLLMYLPPETARELLRGLASVTAPGALLLSHEPHADAAPGLDARFERSVDAATEAAPSWFPLLSERHNHPRVWGWATRLAPSVCLEGPLGAALVSGETALGIDVLTLLRRRD
jgi:SAM-dependent methyltransferase